MEYNALYDFPAIPDESPDYPSYRTKRTSCKFCKANVSGWARIGIEYKLVNLDGTLHRCSSYGAQPHNKGRPAYTIK